MALNTKQQLFAEHYIKLNDATKAAIAAGYSRRSAGSTGHRLLKKDEISAYIRERTAEALARAKMDADEVLGRLSEHARGDMAQFIRVSDSSGEPYIDLRTAKKSLHLVKKVTTKRTKGENFETTEIGVELYDAQAALTTLARHHKLLTDKIQTEDWRRELESLGLNPDAIREEFIQFLERKLSEPEADEDADDD